MDYCEKQYLAFSGLLHTLTHLDLPYCIEVDKRVLLELQNGCPNLATLIIDRWTLQELDDLDVFFRSLKR